MFRSYIRIAWRSLLRNRTLSLINLVGLSISVAFCLLLFFHIRYEQSFDAFHKNADYLYRVEMTNFWGTPVAKSKVSLFAALTREEDEKNLLEFPLVVGPEIKHAFPEVADISRWKDISLHWGEPLVRADKQVYREKHALYADLNFFTLFSFPLQKGDVRTALTDPANVVLSASTARKYFGDRDPIGKTIELVSDSNRLFKVTGVAVDAPPNSSIQYSFILPLAADPNYSADLAGQSPQTDHLLFVELKHGVDRAAFGQKLNAWMRTHLLPDMVKESGMKPEMEKSFHFSLRPLAESHYNAASGWGHYTDLKSIYQLTCIVAIILLLASLNYVLVTVSNAASRSQEIGVRKVMGAGRANVILQFWVETQLLVGIAVLVGLGLAMAGSPLLKSVIGSAVTYRDIKPREVMAGSAVLAVVLGLLAGYYPAMLISRLKPVSILRSFSTFRIRPRFSRVLMVVQFTSCIVLMMAAFVIDRQMEYVTHKDLGFDQAQVLIVHETSNDPDMKKHLKERLYAFARTQPFILSYSAMNGGLTGGANTSGFILGGQRQPMRTLSVDYNYFELLGLKFVKGRPFSPQFASDTARKAHAVVVNEALFNLLGKDVKVGMFNEALGSTIIGVVQNYHFESLSKKIMPEQHRLIGIYGGDFLFKVTGGQVQPAIVALEKEWKAISNNYPFEYSFLDQSIAQMYEADMRWENAIKASCFFAILIACMGLFGLSAINAVNRTKEIGIRKVLGAEVRDIVVTLSSGFLGMVGLAILIAAPLSWWLMNKWLEDFAYRIDISWWMFAVVGTAAVAIAFATVSFQVIRAARANPVKSLRME